MKILADEHIPLMTVNELRVMRHDVFDVRGTSDEGMPDDALWNLAQLDSRLLITCDKGFTRFRKHKHHGILITKLRRPNRQSIHIRILYDLMKTSGRTCSW